MQKYFNYIDRAYKNVLRQIHNEPTCQRLAEIRSAIKAVQQRNGEINDTFELEALLYGHQKILKTKTQAEVLSAKSDNILK